MSAAHRNRRLFLVGAGRYSGAISELAETCGYEIVCVMDDDHDAVVDHRSPPILGPVDDRLRELDKGAAVAVAIGDNIRRGKLLNLARMYGLSTPPLISPYAYVSPSAEIKEAVYVHPAAFVWNDVSLEYGTILSPQAAIAHHTKIGGCCLVSTGASVGASIHVGDGVLIGMGSTVSTGVQNVREGSVVGAGAVVVRDTEPYGIYAGCPAKIIRYRDERGGHQ